MITRVKIKDIKVQWLNATCLNLIARYAKHAQKVDETKIRMSSDTCLADVVEHASNATDIVLKTTFIELKKELRELLARDDLQPKLDAMEKYESQSHYEVGDMSYSQFSS